MRGSVLIVALQLVLHRFVRAEMPAGKHDFYFNYFRDEGSSASTNLGSITLQPRISNETID